VATIIHQRFVESKITYAVDIAVNQLNFATVESLENPSSEKCYRCPRYNLLPLSSAPWEDPRRFTGRSTA